MKVDIRIRPGLVPAHDGAAALGVAESRGLEVVGEAAAVGADQVEGGPLAGAGDSVVVPALAGGAAAVAGQGTHGDAGLLVGASAASGEAGQTDTATNTVPGAADDGVDHGNAHVTDEAASKLLADNSVVQGLLLIHQHLLLRDLVAGKAAAAAADTHVTAEGQLAVKGVEADQLVGVVHLGLDAAHNNKQESSNDRELHLDSFFYWLSLLN